MKLLSSFIFAHVKMFIWAFFLSTVAGLALTAISNSVKLHNAGISVLPLSGYFKSN